MESNTTSKSLYDMRLHDEVMVRTSEGSVYHIVRVPSGWIYAWNDSPSKTNAIFVPTNK